MTARDYLPARAVRPPTATQPNAGPTRKQVGSQPDYAVDCALAAKLTRTAPAPGTYMLAEKIQCPSCWEMIEVFVDPSIPEQQYVEDCSVCCRPLVLTVAVHDDHADIDVVRESD